MHVGSAEFESAANQAYIEVLQTSLQQSQQNALDKAVEAATAVERNTRAAAPAEQNSVSLEVLSQQVIAHLISCSIMLINFSF